MLSLLPGLLADIYPNHYENTYFVNNINKLSSTIISYTRYVDDNLPYTYIIFNGKDYMNNINDNIQFTLETDKNKKLNFLNLTITRLDNKFQY